MHSIIQQIEQNLILIEKGSFLMGSEERFREQPVHKVTFSHDFYLSKYPVTQVLWEAIVGYNPSYFQASNRPVEQVSWNDTQLFFEKINNFSHDLIYRLPTEAEWEYAAIGGKYSKKLGISKLKEIAWWRGNSHSETKSVGLKLSNNLGLYDMSGNVWEWCQDKWHKNYIDAPIDGSAWLDNNTDLHVARGGSWVSNDNNCRFTDRLRDKSSIRGTNFGFRIARF